MEQNDREMAKRKQELCYYGQFYDVQKKISLLAYQILQKETASELVEFSKENYRANDVLKFKDNTEKARFPFASKNFEGYKFRDFLDFFKEISNIEFRDFWDAVANEEDLLMAEHLNNILNQVKLFKLQLFRLQTNDLRAKIVSKFRGKDMEFIKQKIWELSDNYVGLHEISESWKSMSKEEKINCMAKRYLLTGHLNFDSEMTDNYLKKFGHGKSTLCENEMQEIDAIQKEIEGEEEELSQ